MSTFVRPSRVPYYFKAQPSVTPDPLDPVTRTVTDVFIWSIDITSQPVDSTYQIVKTPLNSSNLIILDLAQLVNDFISNTYDGNYSTNVYFVNTSTSFFKADGTAVGTAVSLPEITSFAKGYGLFSEGANPYFTSSVAASTAPEISAGYASDNYEVQVPVQEKITIPVIVTKTATGTTEEINVDFFNGTRADALAGNNPVKSVTVQNVGNDSDQYIQYVDNVQASTAPQTEAQWDELVDQTWKGEIENQSEAPTRSVFWCPENNHPTTYITVSKSGQVGTALIKVNYLRKDKYEPYKITFVNRYGALEDFWVVGSNKQSINVKGDTFKRNLLEVPSAYGSTQPEYNPDAHQYVTFAEQGRKSISLNTGLIPEQNNEVLTQLFLSQKIWLTHYQTQEQRDANEPLVIDPVVLKSKSLQYKTHLTEKVIDYKIDFDLAHDEINQVR